MESIESIEKVLQGHQHIVENETKHVLDLKKQISKARVKEASSNIEDIIAKGVALNAPSASGLGTEDGNECSKN